MNFVRLSGTVNTYPKIFKSKNNWTICKFSLSTTMEHGTASIVVPCNLYGELALDFFSAVDKGAEVAIEGNLIIVGNELQVACKQFILHDERSKRAYSAYVSARINGCADIEIKPLRSRT